MPIDLTDSLEGTPFASAISPIRLEKWSEARAKLSVPHAALPLHQELILNVLQGRVSDKLGDDKSASASFSAAEKLWANPVDAVQRVKSGSKDEREADTRLAAACSALGETYYYFAERKREVAEAIKPPMYNGPATTESILKFIATKEAAWIQKRRRATDEAEQAYSRILSIQPAPPPNWVIAAARRAGDLSLGFIVGVRTTPAPPDWRTKPDLARTYADSIDRALEPFRVRARSAFKTCLDRASKFQIDNADVARCRSALSDLGGSTTND